MKVLQEKLSVQGPSQPGVFSTGHPVQCGHQASCSALSIPSCSEHSMEILSNLATSPGQVRGQKSSLRHLEKKGLTPEASSTAKFIPFLNMITPRNIQIWYWRDCSAGKVLAVCIWGSEFSSPVVHTCNLSTGVQRQEDPWGL